jgi:hypothetical protein
MTLLALLSTHSLTSSVLANTFTLTKKHLDHHPRPPYSGLLLVASFSLTITKTISQFLRLTRTNTLPTPRPTRATNPATCSLIPARSAPQSQLRSLFLSPSNRVNTDPPPPTMATTDPFATSPLRGFGLITGITATEGPLKPTELRVHPLGGPKPFAL